jgi:hypothetical protein
MVNCHVPRRHIGENPKDTKKSGIRERIEPSRMPLFDLPLFTAGSRLRLPAVHLC